jgi:phage terminase Nu1 subunit (DNA packaging protein)
VAVSKVIKMHDLPECRIANRSELAEFLQCSLTTIDDRVNNGMPVIKRPTEADKQWKFDIKACVEWLNNRDMGFVSGEIDPDTLPPREQDYYYSAQKKKLEVGKLKGDLVLLSEVMQENSLRYGVIAQRLRTLPDILERNYGLDTRMAMAAEDFINEVLFNIGQELKGVDAE